MSNTPDTDPSQNMIYDHPDLVGIARGHMSADTHQIDPVAFGRHEALLQAPELSHLAEIPVGARLSVHSTDDQGEEKWTVFIRASVGRDEDWMVAHVEEDGEVTVESAKIVGANFPGSSTVEQGIIRQGMGLEYQLIQRERFRTGAEAKNPRWAEFPPIRELRPDIVKWHIERGSIVRADDGSLVYEEPEYMHEHNTGLVQKVLVELPEDQD